MKHESLGRSPVPGSSPAGFDARYEPEYLALQAEIDKLGFSVSGQATSWPAAAELASGILAEKSKDIQVACYLAVALLEIEGMQGLCSGLGLLDDLLRVFWEEAFPPLKRPRGRIAALDWCRERVLARLETFKEPVPAALRDELLALIRSLDQRMGEVLPDAVSMRALEECVNGFEVINHDVPPSAPGQAGAENAETRALSPEPQARPQAAEPPVPARAAEAPPVPPQENPAARGAFAEAPPVPAQETLAARGAFVDAALRYAFALRKEFPADPLPWRLQRLALWSAVTAPPPAENGLTMLPAPDSDRMKAAGDLLRSGRLLEAALLAEDVFAEAVFCLDAQALVHAALEGLGFAEAAAAARTETTAFTRRLAGVENLRFSDGTAFAAPETLAWLRARENARPPAAEVEANKIIRSSSGMACLRASWTPENFNIEIEMK